MGWFSTDQEFNGAIWFPDDEGVKEWNLTIFFLLVGEFDTVCGVDMVEVVSKRLDFPLLIISSSSSTYRFQRRGQQSKGAVAIACSSRTSIKKFATMGITGLPMAALKGCLYMAPRNSK